MKVAFVESSSAFGGSHISSFEVMEHLIKSDHDLSVEYVVQSQTKAHDEAVRRNLIVKVVSLGKGGISWKCPVTLIRYMYHALCYLKTNKVDVVHATNETLLWWLLPCLLTKAKPVWNVRSEFPTGLKALVRKWVYLIFCRDIIFVSNGAKKSLFTGAPPSFLNTKVIRNFVSSKLLALERPRKDSMPLTIGFIGRLDDPVKDPRRAIIIATQLLQISDSDIHFIFRGQGALESQNELLATVPESFWSCFSFESYSESVIRVFTGIDLLLLTSLNEGLPRVIMEAGTLGIPAVAHDVGGVSELIKEGETGFLFSTNEAAVSSICQLLSEPQMLKNFGRQSQMFFASEFNWRNTVQLYIDFYSGLLKK